ncbi:MAG TPA: DUF3311 domain-containing protein [Pirellulaceae bacterium]|nr:DUF3311 domain-containing protein [Pirellulaceae bacterium]HMO92979.1 DUF3311 domain-containing protein [Pirellulaceae bacterium]HMP67942.1 DUF3311 domain-containing protein [Pirellulaceae bacterium]
MKLLLFIALCILLVLHQDYWQWHRSDIVLGFVPYSLAYHMGLSLLTSIFWILVVSFCWPAAEKRGAKQKESDARTISEEQRT